MQRFGDLQDPYQAALDTNGVDAGAVNAIAPAPSPASSTNAVTNAGGSFDISSLLQQVGQGVQSYEQAQFTTKWLQYALIGFAIWAFTRDRQ